MMADMYVVSSRKENSSLLCLAPFLLAVSVNLVQILVYSRKIEGIDFMY